MQKVLACAFLALSLATLCNARAAGQAKGGAYKGTQYIPTQLEDIDHSPVDVINTIDDYYEGDYDDRSKDPDWVPQPSDYIDDVIDITDSHEDDDDDDEEEEDYDDRSKDPDWVPQPSDYIEEEDNYVDYVYPDEKEIESHEKDYNEEEDELWSSDDDPDYVPDLDDDSQEVVDGGDDHDDHDPDFVPDYDADYGDDHDHDDDHDDDPDFVPDYDADYGDDDDDDDVDDDSKEYDYDYDRDEQLLDELLFEIALLAAERDDPTLGGRDPVEVYFQKLKEKNFTYGEALEFLELVNEVIETESGGSLYIEGEQDTPTGDTYQSEDIQVAKGSSKGKRQTKSLGGYSQQQSGQIQYSVDNPEHFVGVGQHQNQGGSGGIIYHPDRDHADVAEGVEPLGVETGGGSLHEVAVGVDAVDAADDGGSSFGDWFREGWGHVVNAADVVGDRVEDTFSDLGDKISGAVDTVQDAAATAVDKVQDFASTASETIVIAYHKVKGKLPELRQRIQRLFSKFGIMVRRGADYCVQQIQVSVDKVRQAEILDKLQQKLEEGNEEVTAFFTLLGEKITTWAAHSHQHEDIDTGLITIVTSQEGAAAGEQNLPEGGGGGSYGGEQGFPNLFQDQDVVVQLNQMVNSGVITQEDLEQLSQQQTMRQVEYVETIPQQETSGTIQVIHHKRGLRSRLRARRAHKDHRAN